ncbi:MAG: fumarylacetoacetate hydrolase family protein [Acidimicrobiia bacterium]
MKLVTFSDASGPRAGALRGDSVVDLAALGAGPGVLDIVRAGAENLAGLSDAVSAADGVPLDSVHLHAPLPHPPNNVMCVGRNYVDHAREFSAAGFDASEKKVLPDEPIIFTKAVTSIVGPYDEIVATNDPTSSVDYEGELAVVIGPGGRGIPPDEAYDHVFGYTLVNDVTARHLQQRHVQFFIGKSVDTFCPMGPTLITRDEIADLPSTVLRTHVNGELRQEAPLADLIFDIPTLIATLSEAITLQPGDIIATGTPYGTGMSFEPSRFLSSGDLVEVSVDEIGTLRNPVV